MESNDIITKSTLTIERIKWLLTLTTAIKLLCSTDRLVLFRLFATYLFELSNCLNSMQANNLQKRNEVNKNRVDRFMTTLEGYYGMWTYVGSYISSSLFAFKLVCCSKIFYKLSFFTANRKNVKKKNTFWRPSANWVTSLFSF